MKSTLCAIGTFCALSSTAFSLGGPLATPSLGYRGDLDPATEKKAIKAIEFLSDELEFVKGSFVNEFSHFTLAGSMEKAASAIWLVREVGIWNVKVSLQKMGKGKTVLSFGQNSKEDVVAIGVNSDHEDFDRKLFVNFLPGPDTTFAFVKRIARAPEKLEDAAAKGREMAEQDWRAGKKRIFVFGKPATPGFATADEESGLPLQPAAGCVVSESFVDVVSAYNAAMREAAAKEKR